MKYVLAAALAALAVAGCSDRPNTVATPETQALPEACADKPFYSPFPEGLALDMPFHFRSDRIFTKRSGETRRAVTVEYLTGSQIEAQQAVIAAMAAVGYAPKAGKGARKNGVLRQAYTSEGRKSFWVVISPSAGKRPSNPEAKGTIAISWQLSPAPKREAPPAGTPEPGAVPAGSGA
ncbi:MAG TPA: hypothetical protein VKZ91_13585 [Woeseiaceae bacterium]|nr:hypothetical protein [Woeseiaceae bacterium]